MNAEERKFVFCGVGVLSLVIFAFYQVIPDNFRMTAVQWNSQFMNIRGVSDIHTKHLDQVGSVGNATYVSLHDDAANVTMNATAEVSTTPSGGNATPRILQASEVSTHLLGGGGMGSVINPLALVRLEADYHGRELVIDDSTFGYRCAADKAWECFFEPTTTFEINTTDLVYYGRRKPNDARKTWWETISRDQNELDQMAVNFGLPPGTEAHEISRESFKRVFRLKKELQQQVETTWDKLNVSGPCVGVHIRRGDGDSENMWYATKHYVNLIESINASLSTMVILTDDKHSIEEVTTMRPEWIIKSPVADFEVGYPGRDKRNRDFDFETKQLYGERILVDMVIGSKCEYFVGSCSSNVLKVIQNLRRQHYATCLCVERYYQTGAEFCQIGHWKALYNDVLFTRNLITTENKTLDLL